MKSKFKFSNVDFNQALLLLANTLGLFQKCNFGKKTLLVHSIRDKSCALLLLMFLISAVNNNSYSQDYIGTYEWQEHILMNRCEYDGAPYIGTKRSKEESLYGQRFKVISVESDSAIVKILNYKTKNPQFFAYNYVGSKTEFDDQGYPNFLGDEQAYFKVSLTDIAEYAQEQTRIASSLTLGAISFPFKFRPQQKLKDFSGAFNIGGAAGLTFTHYTWRKATWTILASYSLSNIYLDSISTTSNQSELIQANNFNGWTIAFGAMLEFDKVQIAAFWGNDRINQINQSRYGWKYQGKSWFSVGFGFALFSPFEEKPREIKSNNQPL